MSLHWFLLFAAIGTSMGGQVLLKAGAGGATLLDQIADWRTLLGLIVYGGASLLYIVALRKIPMSIALPCTAISYIAAALIGHFAFAEPLTPLHMAAISVIAAGVVMLAWV